MAHRRNINGENVMANRKAKKRYGVCNESEMAAWRQRRKKYIKRKKSM